MGCLRATEAAVPGPFRATLGVGKPLRGPHVAQGSRCAGLYPYLAGASETPKWPQFLAMGPGACVLDLPLLCHRFQGKTGFKVHERAKL